MIPENQNLVDRSASQAALPHDERLKNASRAQQAISENIGANTELSDKLRPKATLDKEPAHEVSSSPQSGKRAGDGFDNEGQDANDAKHRRVTNDFASSAGIDDPNADDRLSDQDADDGYRFEDPFEEQQTFLNQAAQQAGDASIRRRIRVKTEPFNVPAYPQRPLLQRSEYKIRKGILKEAQRKEKIKFRAARLESIAALSSQTHIGGSLEDDQGAAADCQTPHATHHISVMGRSQEVIYCRACACWSLRSKLKGLARRCMGLKEGNASTLRLLQRGVRPAPKARLPPQCVKKRRRRSRW